MRNAKSSPNKPSRFEVRLAGTGGQGVVLAGIILAEAATVDGIHAAQSQAYGPEARGGSSRSEVVMSEGEIDYPWSTHPDILLALTQQGYDENAPDLKEDGLAIVDIDIVKRVLSRRSIGIPFRQIAHNLGEERSINMAALGAVASCCPYVSCNSLSRVIKERLPSSKVEINMRALHRAMELANKARLTDSRSKGEFEI